MDVADDGLLLEVDFPIRSPDGNVLVLRLHLTAAAGGEVGEAGGAVDGTALQRPHAASPARRVAVSAPAITTAAAAAAAVVVVIVVVVFENDGSWDGVRRSLDDHDVLLDGGRRSEAREFDGRVRLIHGHRIPRREDLANSIRHMITVHRLFILIRKATPYIPAHSAVT